MAPIVTQPTTWIDALVAAAAEYGLFIIVAALMLGAIALIIKLWPVLTKVVTIGNALLTLPSDLEAIKADVVRVKSEVLPNGGGSFRDELIAHRVTTAEHFARYDEQITALRTSVARIDGSVRSLHTKAGATLEAVKVASDTATAASDAAAARH